MTLLLLSVLAQCCVHSSDICFVVSTLWCCWSGDIYVTPSAILAGSEKLALAMKIFVIYPDQNMSDTRY